MGLEYVDVRIQYICRLARLMHSILHKSKLFFRSSVKAHCRNFTIGREEADVIVRETDVTKLRLTIAASNRRFLICKR